VQTLLIPRLELEEFPQPVRGYDRLIELAGQEGLEISTIKAPGKIGDPVDIDRINRVIEDSLGYWITSPQLLQGDGIAAIIENRLAKGAVAFSYLGMGKEGRCDLYEELGVEATSIRAVRTGLDNRDSKLPAMLMTLHREDYPEAFRDTALFRGVESVLVQQANGIGCLGPNAQPALAIPASAIRLLDLESDFFVGHFPRPELPVVATAGKHEWRGQLVAFNTTMFHDPYEGIMGDRFPGIEGADNGLLAKNLLRLISGGRPAPSYDWERAFALICSFETALARVTARTLKMSSERNWFDEFAPENVRTKCYERQRQENPDFPAESFLDLIDFKRIWKEHWEKFSPVVSLLPNELGRKAMLGAIQWVNDIRKPAMHATKRVLAGISPPDRSAFAEMERVSNLVQELERLAATR
jgi:hypothetical protein